MELNHYDIKLIKYNNKTLFFHGATHQLYTIEDNKLLETLNYLVQ